MIDTTKCSDNNSRMSIGASKDNDFTVNFLKNQLAFANERLKRATDELDEKESVI